MAQEKQNSPSLFKAVIFGVLIFGLIVFLVISMNTGDILWFWPVFNATPVEMLVNCYGNNEAVSPGTTAFAAIDSAVHTSLTGVKRWDETSMSATTYQEYQTSSAVMVLQLHFDPPATVHSQYAFMKSVDWLIIPLIGRHAETNPVFGIEGNYIDPGSYHVNSTSPIIAALQEQGICSKH